MGWSRFYGTVRGKAATEAARRGDENSGLTATACALTGAIEVRLRALADGRDKFWVRMRRHGSSEGWEGEIASGIMGEASGAEQPGILPVPTVAAILATATDAQLRAELKRRKAQ